MGRKFNYESNGSFGSENGAKMKKLWLKRCWLQCQATVTVSGSPRDIFHTVQSKILCPATVTVSL